MIKLHVELVDKMSRGYVVYFSDGINVLSGNSILIPYEVYNYYKQNKPGYKTKYVIHFKKNNDLNDIEVNIIKHDTHMELQFEDYTTSIKHVNFEKIAKSYMFQSFVDIKTYDENDNMIDYKYKFLNCYDTRSKAVFFMGKFTDRFTALYKNSLVCGGVRYDAVKNIEVFHGDVIYEEMYTFDNRYGGGITIYTFSIISIQKR